jgi:TolB-like protein/tetratricopeptide (TPR) repeat protein
VSALRKLQGDSVGEHRYILTISGRGYRFVAAVKEASELHLSPVEPFPLSKAGEPPADPQREPTRAEAKATSLPAEVAPLPRQGKLSRKALAAALLLLAGMGVLGYVLFRAKARHPPPTTGFNSIAVLPFKVIGGSEADEYLGIGMADGLITRLGSIKPIRVRPTSAVLKYARREADPVAAGHELNVEAVLEGGIRKAGDTIRVTVQLVSVESGTPVWGEKFDEKAADVFTLEDRVSSRVADALRLSLTGEQKKRLAGRHTANMDAYEAYLKGRYFALKGMPEEVKKSLPYFQQAIGIDPNYALAYAGLADAYSALGNVRVGAFPPSEVMPQAKAAALKALALDDSLAGAHASLAIVKMRYEWDWPGAEEELKRALAIDPDDAMIRHWYANYLSGMGRPEEALQEIERAIELDPFAVMTIAAVGMIHYHARQYDQAISECRKAVEMDPSNGYARGYLGCAYQQMGKDEEAIKEIETVARMYPDASLQALGYVYATTGRRDDALKILEQMKERRKQKYYPPYYLAVIYTGLGDQEQALEWLEKAFQERSGALLYLNVEPRFASLRSNQRFRGLLRRMKFVP